jgi:hypothetical protein
MATAVAVLSKPTPTLFDVEEGLTAFLDTAEMVTPDQEDTFLADFEAALAAAADKRDRVAGRIARLEAQQGHAAEEIKRLQAFKKSKESEQTRIEGYVSYVIRRLGKDGKDKWRKLEGNTSILFLRGCAPSVNVVSESLIPLDYKRAMIQIGAAMWDDVLNALAPEFRDVVLAATTNDLSVTVDKVAVKAAIQAGIDVPGAKLITDKTALGRK